MIDIIRKKQKEISEICRKLKVRRLEVFGSAAQGDFNPRKSDIDFLVEFDDPDSPPGLLCRYLTLAEELEQTLEKKVDLITPQSIRNPYFQKAVDTSRQSVYAA